MKFSEPRKKYIILVLLLVFSGCSAKSSDNQIISFFKSYNVDSYLDRMTEEEIHFVDSSDDLALMFYAGEGPSLMLYQYISTQDGIEVVSSASGEYALSGGLSINHIQMNEQHIYFGTITTSHWCPADDTVIPIDWKYLSVADTSGNVIKLDVSSNVGYLCIMDAPLSDFKAVNREDQQVLDLNTYLAQGYYINECEFR